MSNTIYCVYKTTYFGNIFPPKNNKTEIRPTKYIGSSSIEKVKRGYRGSVLSKQYKDLWKKELKENFELFEIEILSEWSTRQEAVDEEYKLQQEFDVVKSPEFFNKSFATKNGFFGRDVSGENNPRFGKNKENCKITRLAAEKIKESNKKFYSIPENNPMFGKDSWNKGQTKDTNERVRKNSEKIKEFYGTPEGKKSLAKGHETRRIRDEQDPSRKERKIASQKLAGKRRSEKLQNFYKGKEQEVICLYMEGNSIIQINKLMPQVSKHAIKVMIKKLKTGVISYDTNTNT